MTMAARANACNLDPSADTSMLDPLPIRVDRMQIVDTVPLEENVYNIAQELLLGQQEGPICEEEADSKQPARIDQTGIDNAPGIDTMEQPMTSYPTHHGNTSNRFGFFATSSRMQQHEDAEFLSWQEPNQQAYQYTVSRQQHQVPTIVNHSIDNAIINDMGLPNEESFVSSGGVASRAGLQSSQVTPRVFNNMIFDQQQEQNNNTHDGRSHQYHHHFDGNQYQTRETTPYSTPDADVTIHTNDEIFGMQQQYPTASRPSVIATGGRKRELSIADPHLSPKGTHDDTDAATYSQFSSIFSDQNDYNLQAPSQPVAKRHPATSKSYTKNTWDERFQELKRHRQKFGHCDVESKDYPSLLHWVKRQRYHYKKLQQVDSRQTYQQQQQYQQQFNLSPERIEALNQLGFIWDSHQATWEKRYHELAEYKQRNGHCNVPTEYAENPELGVWLKGQRRQYSLFRVGRKSAITMERIQKLEELGLQWYLRQSKMTAAKDKDDEEL